jgi:hypothetical protein
MEAICSSETSVDTQGTTLRYVPDDGTLVLYGYEILSFTLDEVFELKVF